MDLDPGSVEFAHWPITTPADEGLPTGVSAELAGIWVPLEFVAQRNTLMTLPDGTRGVPAIRSVWAHLVSGPLAGAVSGAVSLPMGDTPTKVRITRAGSPEAPVRDSDTISVR